MQIVSKSLYRKMDRRSFIWKGATIAAAFLFFGHRSPGLGATKRSYALAPESLLPSDIRQAPAEVREAYRFAIANRDILRYIPCYCGCGSEGHTSNASCYVKDSSKPGNLIFDRMSLG
jgi:hypothetical protein